MCRFLVVLGLGLLGCASAPAVLRAPSEFPGFPSQAQNGAVWLEAGYPLDAADLLGADLAAAGWIPVRVRIGRTAPTGAKERLSDDSLDAHLYLEDGTVLCWASPHEIRGLRQSTRDRALAQALPLSLLKAWDVADEGFLYFRADPARVRVRGTLALSRSGETARELDLLRSLLVLHVEDEQGVRPLAVGLRASRGKER
jgi:hypothetical protein